VTLAADVVIRHVRPGAGGGIVVYRLGGDIRCSVDDALRDEELGWRVREWLAEAAELAAMCED
jgi:hypothetical protein